MTVRPLKMVEQHFCLRWNNYRTNITAEFETLREGEHFVDVTLACDGQQLKAHKVVLSACSPYFKELLQGNPCTHPIIILRDVAYTHMRSLLEFMYAGEVNISQVHLGAFLHTAEALKIRGLAESSDDRKDHGGVNSMSPLSALKSSLSGLGNMGLGGLGTPSILERPLVPQLLPHHSDKPGPPSPVPPHHLAQHMGPPSLPGQRRPPPRPAGGPHQHK
ncbi:longitudinals lacking protein-like isoform X1 [Scylla paramamosain]|uniref:longitudinals lacking protein-like isoform X1 n=2 Tax=Scylla paramamosain TaxID=85552 RepID=UPI003083026A